MSKMISPGEKIFYIANYIILGIAAFIAMFPFINVIATSFSSSRAILSGEVSLLPVDFNIGAYTTIIEAGQLINAFYNTVIITAVGTAINMAATILTAYPLSKKRLVGRKVLMSLMVFTMLFGGGLIPTFIVIKNLNLINTYGALWLPSMISVYNMIIMRTFFQNIPPSLEEAAAIDGAKDLYILVKIILPLSMPVIATVTLFYAVSWWNNYFNVLIYITNEERLSLMVKLMQILNNFSESMRGEGTSEERLTPEAVKAASIIVSTTPILCVYPFLQKYFVKGVMIGSVKG